MRSTRPGLCKNSSGPCSASGSSKGLSYYRYYLKPLLLKIYRLGSFVAPASGSQPDLVGSQLRTAFEERIGNSVGFTDDRRRIVQLVADRPHPKSRKNVHYAYHLGQVLNSKLSMNRRKMGSSSLNLLAGATTSIVMLHSGLASTEKRSLSGSSTFGF